MKGNEISKMWSCPKVMSALMTVYEPSGEPYQHDVNTSSKGAEHDEGW